MCWIRSSLYTLLKCSRSHRSLAQAPYLRTTSFPGAQTWSKCCVHIGARAWAPCQDTQSERTIRNFTNEVKQIFYYKRFLINLLKATLLRTIRFCDLLLPSHFSNLSAAPDMSTKSEKSIRQIVNYILHKFFRFFCSYQLFEMRRRKVAVAVETRYILKCVLVLNFNHN